MFLPLDVVYTLVFIPGIIAALFGYYHIVGIMTLLVLPLALLWNGFILRTQRLMFKSQDLRVRRNGLGFFTYVIGYSMVLQPICVWGYLSGLSSEEHTYELQSLMRISYAVFCFTKKNQLN